MSLGIRDFEVFNYVENRSFWEPISPSSFGTTKLKNKIILVFFFLEKGGREEREASSNYGASL